MCDGIADSAHPTAGGYEAAAHYPHCLCGICCQLPRTCQLRAGSSRGASPAGALSVQEILILIANKAYEYTH